MPGVSVGLLTREAYRNDCLHFTSLRFKVMKPVTPEGKRTRGTAGMHSLVRLMISLAIGLAAHAAHAAAIEHRRVWTFAQGSGVANLDSGVRIFGPNATVAQDFEPEHIAAANDRAWVTLQENNAMAVVTLRPGAPPEVSKILPLGFKDHGRDRNALDVSDIDGAAGNLQTHENLFGMYQPDGIAVGVIGGERYLFTAHEGDARDYPLAFSEKKRVGTPGGPEGCPAQVLPLDPASFTASEDIALCKLRVTFTLGSFGDGDYEQLYSFGGRSFAVWNTNEQLVFDSGKGIEALLATEFPGFLADTRSDDKGPEPEDLVLGTVAGVPYLFVGLERADGVLAVDVTDVAGPRIAGFIGGVDCPPERVRPCRMPERLAFVPARFSPSGQSLPPLLLVTNELSATTEAYELRPGQ
jgi:2',3'-cyclic-nucleotide 2'-phosphodiesterase / 3'-nucleotidase / 5'-nucleotidase